MKVTKPQIIIHAFALTHAVVSLVCKLGGIADDLLLISEDKSNYLIKKDGKRFVIDSTMDNLEKDLNPDDFFRICRGAIVSRSSILSSTRQMGGRLKLNLITELPRRPLRIPRKGREFPQMAWLDNNTTTL